MSEEQIRRKQGIQESESRYLDSYDPQVRRVYRLIMGACGYAHSTVFPWYDSERVQISEGAKVLSTIDRIYSLAFKDHSGKLESDHISDAASAYIILKIGLQKSKEPTPEMFILFNYALPVVSSLFPEESETWDIEEIKKEAIKSLTANTAEDTKPPALISLPYFKLAI